MTQTRQELETKIRALEKLARRTREAFQITRTARRNYKRFLQFLPYPILVRDPEGLVTYLNSAFTETFGWTLKEMKGTDGMQYVPLAIRDELRDKIEKLPIRKSVLEFYTQRVTKDGKTLDVLLRVGVERSQSSNPGGMIIVIRDVTQEKRFNRNREAMNRISQKLPEYPDLKQLLFYINTEIKDLLNTESANTILLDESQKQFYFISATHDDPITRERIEKSKFPVEELLSGQVLKTGTHLIVNDFADSPYQYEARDRKIGYTVRNVILVPLRIQDRIIGTLGADNKKNGSFDETDLETMNTLSATVALSIENARVSRELRKAYEELKGLNRAKDKMISHLSHELKTPVAILLSSHQVLSKRLSELPEETWKPTMERVKRNLDRILGIEDEVYDIVEKKEHLRHRIFSLILDQCQDVLATLIAEETGESGVIEKVRRKIDDLFNTRDHEFQYIFLDRFVEERITAIQPEMAHRRLSLISRLKPGSPIRIPAEPLRKTVDGLIRNAVENTPDGGKIEIFVHEEGKGMMFVVKDHGIGLTQEARKRIFEGFFANRDTMSYSSGRPYDFNAGGKGADLLRMKIFSERFDFRISMTSRRCSKIPENKDACPGSVAYCQKIPGPSCNGMTIVTCFFPFPESR